MSEPGPDTLRGIHRTMVRIRAFEERVQELFLARKLPGFVHVYVGEEAVAAGVCAALAPADAIPAIELPEGNSRITGCRPRAEKPASATLGGIRVTDASDSGLAAGSLGRWTGRDLGRPANAMSPHPSGGGSRVPCPGRAERL